MNEFILMKKKKSQTVFPFGGCTERQCLQEQEPEIPRTNFQLYSLIELYKLLQQNPIFDFWGLHVLPSSRHTSAARSRSQLSRHVGGSPSPCVLNVPCNFSLCGRPHRKKGTRRQKGSAMGCTFFSCTFSSCTVQLGGFASPVAPAVKEKRSAKHE